jgi:hypothetical protein
MVGRFVAVSQDHAEQLVTAAAERLGAKVRQLDYAIWLYERSNGRTRCPRASSRPR